MTVDRELAKRMRDAAKELADATREVGKLLNPDDMGVQRMITNEATGIQNQIEGLIWFFGVDTAVNPHTGKMENPKEAEH